MSFNVRDVNFVTYRLFFIYLFFLCGAGGLAIVALEFVGISVIRLDPRTSYDAYIATCWVASIVSCGMGWLMLQLIKERRGKKGKDRRQRNIPIDFPDRRKGDRRTA
ncbi:MAG: hypothetical protein DIZ80_15580 [endosymbiont of Galathealinum brachiosum]|uniref:Transmembrane protein n=1 Tax=endosymbiont of Galathealinum brachiosum TaxID=2200906 RepID=A0A370D9E3_9GAMM|nr:MAG: hypothetical protein DIZ80_15580 [endosymbiont of Galathealinum brachiosum]